MRLARFRNVGIAERDDVTRHRLRIGRGTAEHDGDRVAGFHAQTDRSAEAFGRRPSRAVVLHCHRISSLTSSYGSAWSRKPYVPRVFSSRAMSRMSASAARAGPDPMLTRATPIASSS